jgi:amino acid transporter
VTPLTPPAGSWLSEPHGRVPRAAAVTVAALGQVLVLVPFTVASGLMAPLWAVVVLLAAWTVAAVGLVLLARRRPFVTPLVPVGSFVLWWLVMTAGERLLGWAP